MSRVKRWIAIAPVLVGLGWVSAYAVEMGTAGAIAFDAGKALNAGAAADDLRSSQLRADLLAAQARQPMDASVHELLGVLAARRGNRPEYLAEADVQLRKAIELRPTSPYTWANLLSVRYRLGDSGPAIEKLLARSAMLGPFEPEVQRSVAHFGLAVWDEVAPETRAAIEGMVAAGMRRNPVEMLQIAQRRGRLPLPCRHLPGAPRLTDPKWSQLCQSMEAT